MSRPTITIYDCETNKTIEREMNDSEFAQYQKDIQTTETFKAEAEAKATQRQALLARLGITEEEARILLGGN